MTEFKSGMKDGVGPDPRKHNVPRDCRLGSWGLKGPWKEYNKQMVFFALHSVL